jgi:hypothetical protein
MTTDSDLWAEMTAPCELDPELQPCVLELSLGQWIKHKFVNDIYTPQMNARYNKTLKYKRESVATARAARKWDTFILLHERPWRYEALMEIADEMDDHEFWDAVRMVWMDSENIREHGDEWDELLRSERPGSDFLMDDDERKALDELPQEVTLYQGHTDERDDGWSWTTRRETAVWFAHRFQKLEEATFAMLSTVTVDKDLILAYLLGRGEFEVLIAPEHTEHGTWEALP